jgi:Ohr subfamily peroxiredoxin
MGEEIKVLYTTEATVQGGREGHARTTDGRLEVDLDVPAEMGGSGGPGTNPEQLFAAGYAACFQSALLRVAAGRKLDLSASRITARVGIGPAADGGFGLTVALELDAPGIAREDAIALMERAHDACPYSKATRGSVDVALLLAGSTNARRPA